MLVFLVISSFNTDSFKKHKRMTNDPHVFGTGQEAKRFSRQDQTLGGIYRSHDLFFARMKTNADALVIKFRIYCGYSEIGIHSLRSLKMLWIPDLNLTVSHQIFFLSSYFHFHTSEELPWRHQEWNFTGMLQKLASTQTATEKQRNGTWVTAEMRSINI